MRFAECCILTKHRLARQALRWDRPGSVQGLLLLARFFRSRRDCAKRRAPRSQARGSRPEFVTFLDVFRSKGGFVARGTSYLCRRVFHYLQARFSPTFGALIHPFTANAWGSTAQSQNIASTTYRRLRGVDFGKQYSNDLCIEVIGTSERTFIEMIGHVSTCLRTWRNALTWFYAIDDRP